MRWKRIVCVFWRKKREREDLNNRIERSFLLFFSNFIFIFLFSFLSLILVSFSRSWTILFPRSSPSAIDRLLHKIRFNEFSKGEARLGALWKRRALSKNRRLKWAGSSRLSDWKHVYDVTCPWSVGLLDFFLQFSRKGMASGIQRVKINLKKIMFLFVIPNFYINISRNEITRGYSVVINNILKRIL